MNRIFAKPEFNYCAFKNSRRITIVSDIIMICLNFLVVFRLASEATGSWHRQSSLSGGYRARRAQYNYSATRYLH